jgi:HEAT repeat protein
VPEGAIWPQARLFRPSTGAAPRSPEIIVDMVSGLVDAAGHDHPSFAAAAPVKQVRKEAALALAQLRVPWTSAALLDRLSDEIADVRRAAAHALGEVGSRPAAGPLRALLEDPDAEVRSTVAHALASLEGEQGAPVLDSLPR